MCNNNKRYCTKKMYSNGKYLPEIKYNMQYLRHVPQYSQPSMQEGFLQKLLSCKKSTQIEDKLNILFNK